LRGAFARERDAFAIEGDVRDEETASDAPSKRLFIASTVSTPWSPMPASWSAV
jgi:hypothetical protein